MMLKRLSRRGFFKLGINPYGEKAPIFLCSYPKSGRTWLRFILASYLNAYYGLNREVDLQSVFCIIPNHGGEKERGTATYAYMQRPEVPLIICSHIAYDDSAFGPHRRIFLIRAVYDVLVSHYFHISRQKQNYEDDLASFIREPAGVANYIAYLNSWAPRLPDQQACVLTYERLSDNTYQEVEKALRFGDFPVEPLLLEAAIEKADFKKMRQVELAKGIAGHSYNPDDEEARRVRRGVVGGYTDYLSEEDQEYIRQACLINLSTESLDLLRLHHLLP